MPAAPLPLLYPLVSVSVALFSVDQDALQVLLLQRARDPEARRWAMPGAVLKPQQDADLEATALRALRDKIGVEIANLAQVGAFSGATRDPRGWSVGVLFYALLPSDQVQALVKSRVNAVKWAPACRPGHRLAFDHGVQLGAAVSALREKVERHALPLQLLPERFTVTALQRTCEAVLGRPLDKSVFRRRLKGSNDLIELAGEFAVGAQRPARLFRAR